MPIAQSLRLFAACLHHKIEILLDTVWYLLPFLSWANGFNAFCGEIWSLLHCFCQWNTNEGNLGVTHLYGNG